MAFAGINTGGNVPLNGSIALSALYKEQSVTENEIKLHHHLFCKNWYNIDHNDITFKINRCFSKSHHHHHMVFMNAKFF